MGLVNFAVRSIDRRRWNNARISKHKNDSHVWSIYFDSNINQISKFDEYGKSDTRYLLHPLTIASFSNCLTLNYLKSRTLVTEFPKPCHRFPIEVNDLRTLCSDSALQARITVHEIKRLSLAEFSGIDYFFVWDLLWGCQFKRRCKNVCFILRCLTIFILCPQC